MGRVYQTIEAPVQRFIEEQPMFFVATAPLAGGGHVNLSPKGMDTLRVIDPTTVAYVDLVGSGAETIAHVRENGRITLMWCSFGEKPRIVRVYGNGSHLVPGNSQFEELLAAFPPHKNIRSIIRIDATRSPTLVASECPK